MDSWEVLEVVEEVPTDLVPLYDQMMQQSQYLKRKTRSSAGSCL
jgi:hypothetical protein